jgi:hypothetical protein
MHVVGTNRLTQMNYTNINDEIVAVCKEKVHNIGTEYMKGFWRE